MIGRTTDGVIATTAKAAFDLRYTWTGWPSRGKFAHVRPELLNELKPIREQDGLRLLESVWTVDAIKLTFSTTPNVSPVLPAGCAKGRLDHAMRTAGIPISFSRKVAVRSVGESTRQNVEQYIVKQVDKERFVDPVVDHHPSGTAFEERNSLLPVHWPDRLFRDNDFVQIEMVILLGRPSAAQIDVDPHGFDLQPVDGTKPNIHLLKG